MASQFGTHWVHEEDPSPKSKEDAERFLSLGIDVTGTPAAVYLSEHRRIEAPYPADLKYIADARTAESALMAPLYFNDRPVAVQLIHLDRDGRKSVVEPVKQRFSIEHAPGAVFAFPYDGDSTDIVICEG